MCELKMKFGVVVEKDEYGYYVASVPELTGCHTQAKTLDAVMERVRKLSKPAWRQKDLKAVGNRTCWRSVGRI